MSTTLGTSSSQYAMGATNSRLVAYSPVSGTGTWYAVWNNGSAVQYATSTDGVTWASAAAVTGIGFAPAAFYYPGALEVDANNKIHLVMGVATSGAYYYTQYTASGWWATPGSITSVFNGSLVQPYVSGANTYVYAVVKLNSSTATTLDVVTNPSSGSAVLTKDYAFISPSGSVAADRTVTASFGLEKMGSTIIILNTDQAATPNLYYGTDTMNGTAHNTNPTGTNAFSAANLDHAFCTVVDGSGVLHVVYHITGTGWLEATYNGSSWTTAGALTQIVDNDRYPILSVDSAGSLHLFYCRYNAANDYGIGHIAKASGGSWAAQADLVSHNTTNRTSLTSTRNDTGGSIMLSWLEGTATTWTVMAQAYSTGAAPTLSRLGVLGVG